MMMRNTGIGLSAVLVALGAILAWAVTYEASGIDIQRVGMILFLVGCGLGFITVVMAAAGRRTTVHSQHENIVNGQPVVEHRREVITEKDPVA